MIENINLDKARVSAEMHGYLYAAVYGKSGVFDYGSKLDYELVSNNEIKVKDGLLLNNGRFMRIVGTESVAIENGVTGESRTDLIVAHFETDGINEVHDIRVIKGSSGGSAPEPVQEDIYNGGAIHELPLYRIYINGLSVERIEKLFELIDSTKTISNRAYHENLVINGGFKVWQRGSSFSNAQNQYCADRFYIANAKSPTELVERSTEVPNAAFQNSIHIRETSSENTYLRYRLENALKGTFTLSFWYKTNVKFNTYIYDGALRLLGSSNESNEWTKAKFTFEASAMTYFNLIHAVNVGEIYITGVKLERGDNATDFEPRLSAEELMLCQRYFIKGHQDMLDAVSASSTTFWGGSIPMMRTTPTVTISSLYSDSGAQIAVSSVSTFNVSNGILKNIIFSSAQSSRHIRYVADFDAEIY